MDTKTPKTQVTKIFKIYAQVTEENSKGYRMLRFRKMGLTQTKAKRRPKY